MLSLQRLDLPGRVLATGFLVVLSAGFGVAHLYLHHTVAPQRTLPTLKDITVHFHGTPETTRFKNMVLGPMKKYFSEAEDPKQLTPAEQADLDRVLAWNDAGAPEADFWDPRSHQDGEILQILLNRQCLDCHSPDSRRRGAKPDSPLDTYPAIKKYTQPNTGMDEGRLLMLSHVHLLGMALMFLGAGAFVAASAFPVPVRTGLIGAGFASILVDIGGWWAVKWWGAAWAPAVLAGGALMGIAFGLSILAALFDLWLRKRPADGA